MLRDSRAACDEATEVALRASDDDLFTTGRFPWAGGDALGPRFIGLIGQHFHEEHEPAIRAWLATDERRRTRG